MKKIFIFFVVFFICTNLYADKIRVFKRLSDGKIMTSQIVGKDEFFRSEDDDFKLLFGQLEAYDIATLPSLPSGIKTLDVNNGNAIVTQYTQKETEDMNGTTKKNEIDAAKQSLKNASNIDELKSALETILEIK